MTIEHATAITVPQGARALVDLDGGSVLVTGGAGRGRWIYLGIEIRRGATSRSAIAFPVLIANALHALGGASDVISAETIARSEIALRDAPENDVADESPPRWRVGFAPSVLLALLGALLLGSVSRRGPGEKGAWANGMSTSKDATSMTRRRSRPAPHERGRRACSSASPRSRSSLPRRSRRRFAAPVRDAR